MTDLAFTQNRELSWLAFNDRVLTEATDETVPLLERLKFVSIFTSNLDEFFMIRVGSLFDLAGVKADARDRRSGMTPKEQLEAIYAAVRPLYRGDLCLARKTAEDARHLPPDLGRAGKQRAEILRALL